MQRPHFQDPRLQPHSDCQRRLVWPPRGLLFRYTLPSHHAATPVRPPNASAEHAAAPSNTLVPHSHTSPRRFLHHGHHPSHDLYPSSSLAATTAAPYRAKGIPRRRAAARWTRDSDSTGRAVSGRPRSCVRQLGARGRLVRWKCSDAREPCVKSGEKWTIRADEVGNDEMSRVMVVC
jgi:hypothetical protein